VGHGAVDNAPYDPSDHFDCCIWRMAKLTEDHLLLLEKHRSGTRYREILGEMRHRGIDAKRQQEMYDEIRDHIFKSVKGDSQDTIKRLLSK
tara:strand:+ start:609 stop:881 length:273 start_codon:yes stop_codon:yes gene_type:complete